MVGVSFEVTIDDSDVQRKGRILTDRLDNMAPFYASMGEMLTGSTIDRFNSQTSPDGAKWKPHAPATIAGRLKRHGNAPLTILRLSGRLAGSINYQPSSDQVEIGNNVVYGAIHQFSGKAGRGRKVFIPARPYLGFSDEDRAQTIEILDDYLLPD